MDVGTLCCFAWNPQGCQAAAGLGPTVSRAEDLGGSSGLAGVAGADEEVAEGGGLGGPGSDLVGEAGLWPQHTHAQDVA